VDNTLSLQVKYTIHPSSMLRNALEAPHTIYSYISNNHFIDEAIKLIDYGGDDDKVLGLNNERLCWRMRSGRAYRYYGDYLHINHRYETIIET